MKAYFENIVFKRQKKVLCVGIFLINRNDWRISFIQSKLHNNEINIVASAENLKELKDSKELMGDHVPVILHIDGWGVLIKENGTDNNSIPIDGKEFFLKEYSNPNGNGSYFSIIRIDLLNSIIDFCSSASLHVTGVFLGPFNVGLLSPYFENENEIRAGKWNLALNQGFIHSFHAAGVENETTYSIGGDSITSGLLPLYGDIVAFFSGDRVNNPIIAKSREEYVYGRLIKYLGVTSLGVVLLLLLVNFFIWDSLRQRSTALTSEVASNVQLLSQLEEKKLELKEKESLVAQYIGTNEKTHYAWYADRLGATLPSGIHLTGMDIQPINRKLKNGVPIEYQSRLIEVEGNAENMSQISEWINAIRKENWAKQVELISFHSDNEQAKGHFKLQINY